MFGSEKRCSGWLGLCFALAVAISPVVAEEINFELAAGEQPRENSPVRVAVEVPAALLTGSVATVEIGGAKIPAQITSPRLLSTAQSNSADKVAAEIVFIIPQLAAKTTVSGKAVITAASGTQASTPSPQFQWKDTPSKHLDLNFGDKPVLRYMYEALDTSSKERRAETMKVYHHVFDPTGKHLVTKGPGGQFPHHRGLYFGFNRISYGEKLTADTWHCNNGEFQSHEKVISSDVGPVLGRHRVEVAWHGKTGDVFAREERELTTYATERGILIEFATRLKSEVGPVKLDGDPQHAGFQFRASQEVAEKTKNQTYYLRPDGKGKPGEFRNWPAQKEHANLPWHAMSFVVAGQRYTCCYLDRPENPKESRFSERDYGRFGSYFEYQLDRDKPLALNYRVWLQAGEMNEAAIAALDNDFIQPAVVKVK